MIAGQVCRLSAIHDADDPRCYPPAMGLGMSLVALAAGTARRLGEIGFIVGAIGGIFFIAGAAALANSARGSTARTFFMLAGLCIAVAFVLGIAAFHWGRY